MKGSGIWMHLWQCKFCRMWKMMKKLVSTAKAPLLFFIILIVIWEMVGILNIVPKFMLPAPSKIFITLIDDRKILLDHLIITLSEAIIGLFFGVVFGIIFATIMDISDGIKRVFHPLIVLSQTIPTVAVAPLFVLWFGYGLFPKVVLVALTTFFPIAMGVYEGLGSVSDEYINLFLSMRASKVKIYTLLKFPLSMPYFFAGLKISVSYAIVGAVISEWLGGFKGLGVYMTRVKNAYAFDKMFAAIIIIALSSLVLMGIVSMLRNILVKWED